MLQYKNILIGLFFVCLGFVQSNQLVAQDTSNCVITDPLVGYDATADIDYCCGIEIEEELCYSYSHLTNAEFPLYLHHITLNVADCANRTWSAEDNPNDNIEFSSWEDLITILNNIVSNNPSYGTFELNSEANLICNTANNESLGYIVIGQDEEPYCASPCSSQSPCDGSTEFSTIECYCLFPSFVEGDCPIEIPDMSPLVDGVSSDDVTDTPLFQGDGWSFSGQDYLDNSTGFEEDEYGAAPDDNSVGFLISSLAESGLLQYGAGCADINCIDVLSLANNFESGTELGNFYDSELTNELGSPNGGGSWTDYINNSQNSNGESLNDVLTEIQNSGGGLAGFLNNHLGLNLPTNNCPEGEAIISTDSIEMPEIPFTNGGSVSKGNKKGKETAKSIMMNNPRTAEDINYFSGEIPGLGTGGGASSPSPSSLEMIKNINAGVNLYNGSQSSGIPLYSINANDINIPISLSSTNNGLKVNDMGSLAGQNWNLNAGGMISRVVQGLPDEFDGVLTGYGAGKNYTLLPRLEVLSNIGLSIDFSNDLPETACDIIPIEEKLLNGFRQQFNLGGVNFPNQGVGVPIKLNLRWRPIQPNLINATVSIPIYPVPGTNIIIYLEAGINFGVTLSEELGMINYEETGKGYFHLDETPFDITSFPSNNTNLSSLSDSEALDVLEKAHANRKIEDRGFFSDQFATWEKWIEAIEYMSPFHEVVKETVKLDTEPDEFYFSVGGYSGKFMFNATDSGGTDVVIFPSQDLVIDKEIVGNHIVKFTITTPEGMQYTFGSTDTYRTGVDFSQNTNYYLPNFYTYPENDYTRTNFGKAQLEVAQMVQTPIIGSKRLVTYANTYERNYKIMDGPRYSSAWHLVSVRSLLTQEEIDLEYTKRPNLKYYASKNFSHSFPNFGISGDNLTSIENTDLNPLHTAQHLGATTKWENGRAEFSYSVTETELDRWDLTRIATNRGEAVDFIYAFNRGEIYNDKVCSRIEVRRGLENPLDEGYLFKGWELDYEIINQDLNQEADCSSSSEDSSEIPISMSGELSYNLGEKYDLKDREHHKYFFFNFRIFQCLTLPARVAFPFFINKEGMYHKTELKEYSSVMYVKALNQIYDEATEEAIYNAEYKRTFLNAVRELDKTGAAHEFVTIDYEGNLTNLPKRFSTQQDFWGYYNDNISGSLLPKIKYTPITGGGNITSETSNVDFHFPFYNVAYSENMHLGQDDTPVFNKVKIGALQSIRLATGASISYEYQLNELPSDGSTSVNGAGLIVERLIENPGDAEPKYTRYKYEIPTVVNEPIRLYASPYDYYYKLGGGSTPSDLLEQKIHTSSGALNRLFSNKTNHVGYAEVTEIWDENVNVGQRKHYFTTPENVFSHFEPFSSSISNTKYYNKKLHANDGTTSVDTNLNPEAIPPGLRMNEIDFQNWLFGIEYRTETIDEGGTTRQATDYTFETYQDKRAEGIPLHYFKSNMYQYHYHGSFWQNYIHRNVINYQPFGIVILEDLFGWLVQLMPGIGVLDHPYKNIQRNYLVSDRILQTNNIRLRNTTTTNYLADGTNSATTTYHYSGSYDDSRIPSVVTTLFSDGTSSSTVNVFVDSPDISEFDKFAPEAITYLSDEVRFNQPLFSKSYINGSVDGNGLFSGGTLVASDFTALGLQAVGDENRIIPIANYTYRSIGSTAVLEDNSSLVGEFTDHNADGKPVEYRIAEYGADAGSEDLEITLEWNDQLQLKSRRFQDFETTYTYDDEDDDPTNYFVLISTTDPDGIVTTYDYDDRWRLEEVVGSNGLQTTTYNYNIAPSENWINTTLSFTDGTPSQGSTQYVDGFGRPKKLIRDNDGAPLSAATYDGFFRQRTATTLGKGTTTIEYIGAYPDSPIPFYTRTIDAVGNETISITSGGGSEGGNIYHSSQGYFAATAVTDANGHTTTSYVDGLGRTLRTKGDAITEENSEQGNSITSYSYDPLSRLEFIINPIGETYQYIYNGMNQVASKKVPGSGATYSWYDDRFRLAASQDARGNVLTYAYDNNNRLTSIALQESGNPQDPTSQDPSYGLDMTVTVDNTSGTLLQENIYDENGTHTWVTSSYEAILDASGSVLSGQKYTDLDIDGLGRVEFSEVSYPDGIVQTRYDINDAGQATGIRARVDGPQMIEYDYRFTFDDILRPEQTFITFGDEPEKLLSELLYNDQDQVRAKLLGHYQDNLFLQKVDYLYDAAGKLTTINSEGDSECTNEGQVCELTAEFVYTKNPKGHCSIIQSMEIDGETFILLPSIDMTDTNASLAEALTQAINDLGFTCTVSINENDTEGGVLYTFTITDANFTNLSLILTECPETIDFEAINCCETDGQQTGGGNISTSLNGDLYYQHMVYNHIDISDIFLTSDCGTGTMHNQYTYDANHRIVSMNNTTPNYTGAYNTAYGYDLAGNILGIQRNGLISLENGTPTYGEIDRLDYTYGVEGQGNPSGEYLLMSVTDNTSDAIARAKGFGASFEEGINMSNFHYDGAGNIVHDSGKGLDIEYNLLNLPRQVSGEGTMDIDYTFSGEKIKKHTTGNEDDAEERIYLGGVEYKDDVAEHYNHGDGRIVLAEGQAFFQYKITDHLGNTVVLFSDTNGDGEITETNTSASEVLQRNLYYPFGMALEGTWNASTTPNMDYLYNGKELADDLGLDWQFYGFRMYDPAVGRFTGVDPISDQFAWVSTFNYAENSPIANIDLWGLQSFYAADGSLLHNDINSDEERVIHGPRNSDRFRDIMDTSSEEKIEQAKAEFLSDELSAKIYRGEDLNSIYDDFALKYKNQLEGETAMAIYRAKFQDADDNSFYGYQLGNIVTSSHLKDGGGRVVIGLSTIPYTKFWKIYSAIHTHPPGSDTEFSGLDTKRGGGPRFGFMVTNDLGWAIHNEALILLALPSSNEIATFDPWAYSIYDELFTNRTEMRSHYRYVTERNALLRKAITYRTIGD